MGREPFRREVPPACTLRNVEQLEDGLKLRLGLAERAPSPKATTFDPAHPAKPVPATRPGGTGRSSGEIPIGNSPVECFNSMTRGSKR